MKVDIVSKEKNKLLEREEIEFEIKDSKSSPSRKEVRESIAALSETKPENVVIEEISSNFGTKDFGGKARVYDKIENLKKTELKYLSHRDNGTKIERKPKPMKEKGKGKK